MMALLSKGLGNLVGPWLGSLVVPALLLALAVTGHKLWEGHNDRVETAATNECNSSWRLVWSKRKERVAVNELETARVLMGEKERLIEESRNALETLQREHQALVNDLRSRPPAGDAWLISDGMRNDLIRRYGVGGEGRGSQKGR